MSTILEMVKNDLWALQISESRIYQRTVNLSEQHQLLLANIIAYYVKYRYIDCDFNRAAKRVKKPGLLQKLVTKILDNGEFAETTAQFAFKMSLAQLKTIRRLDLKKLISINPLFDEIEHRHLRDTIIRELTPNWMKPKRDHTKIAIMWGTRGFEISPYQTRR